MTETATTTSTATEPGPSEGSGETAADYASLIDAAGEVDRWWRTGNGENPGEVTAFLDGIPDFPLLDSVALKFNLTGGEKALLLLLAVQEVDPSCGDPADPGALPRLRSLADFSRLFPAAGDPRMLLPSRPLRRWNLVEVHSSRIDPSPLVHSPLRLDERLLAFLLADTSPDERLAAAVDFNPPLPVLTPAQAAVTEKIAACWREVPHFGAFPSLSLRGADPDALKAAAWEAARSAGLNMASLKAGSLPETIEDRREWLVLWEREALLMDSALYLDAFDAGPAAAAAAADWLLHCGGAVLLGHRETLRLPHHVVQFESPETRPADREQLISAALNGKAAGHRDFAERLAGQFDLGAGAVYEACLESTREAERREGEGEGADLLGELLWKACRERSRPRLGGLVGIIESRVSWDDLILPEAQIGLLREAVDQVSGRVTVHEKWGFAAKSQRGLSMTALFSGPSGTGKTLAAEVMANHLDLDLLRVDLSSVVSKYIGETEKHLNEIFNAAEAGGAVLLFDEADALFGPRSKVNDSRDRNANIEVSFLLQRLECYRGLALLTTNLKENLDHAFLRRIRFHVEFPFPDRATRTRLWQCAFPPDTPLDGIEFDKLSRLSLAGGSIRNIAINAAFQAAADGTAVTMEHLAHSARNEFRKAEKPVPEGELKAMLQPGAGNQTVAATATPTAKSGTS